MGLIIFDGTNLVHRCRHATSLSTSSGQEVGGIYGSIRSLLATMRRFPGWKPISAWDSWSRSRVAVYPNYKASRRDKYTPEERKVINAQLMASREVFLSFGVPAIRLYDMEADDIIGHLVCSNPEEEIIVVSTDRDMYQLLDGDRVRVLKGDVLWGEDDLRVRTSMTALQYRLFHAIRGDVSDWIKGIPSVGEKTVEEIMGILPEDFSYDPPDFDRLAAICEDHKKKRIRRVADGIDIVRRNFELVNLRPPPHVCSLKAGMILEALVHPNPLDVRGYVELCLRYEFESMMGWTGWTYSEVACWDRDYEGVGV